MKLRQSISWLVVAVASLSVVVSCGGEVPGTPTTGSTTGAQTTTSPSRTPTATTSASGPGLSAVDPCELLTSAERAQLDLPDGEPDTTAGDRECVWNQPGDGAVVSVTLNEGEGIDDLNPSNPTKVEDITIGGRAGRRLEYSEGNCQFDLAVTEKSSATVATLIPSKIAEACAFSQQVVNIVEPKLPKG